MSGHTVANREAKIKLIIVADFDSFGGARTFFERLIRFYRRFGCEVVVALTIQQLDDPVRRFLVETECEFVVVPERPKGFMNIWGRFPMSAIFDLYCYVLVIAPKNPDVIVVSSISPGHFLGLGVLPGRLLYIVHNYPQIAHRYRWLVKLRQRMLRSMFGGRRKRIATVSQFSAARIREAWFGDERAKNLVSIIYNAGGIEGVAVTPIGKKCSKQVFVLTLGHVAYYKNPFGWIRVAERVVRSAGVDIDIRFAWAGNGKLLDECRRKVKELRLARNVEFLGYREDVGSLYEAADIYFQPSLIESHGIAVVDALYAGIPAVVSEVGGLPESVINGETGFVVPVDDEENMMRSILMLAKDKALQTRMGEAGRALYYRRFATSRWVEDMVRIHDELGVQLVATAEQ